MPMKLRPYQDEAIRRTFEIWQTKRAALVCLPTGCGKSCVGADIIRKMLELHPRRKAMVFAHRMELIEQLAGHLQRATGLEVGIEMGESRADTSGMFGQRIIVSTVQSLTTNIRRLQRFKPEEFCVLWNDESHRILGNSYRKVIDHFKQNPDLKILGVTATPERGDGAALGQVFDEVAINYGVQEAVHDGWLVRPKQMYVRIDGIDISRVKTQAGDLHPVQLGHVMEEDKNARAVVDAIHKTAGTQKTIVFASSVAHAEKMCAISNLLLPNSSRVITGETPKEDRERTHEMFRSGEITRLFNMGVLIEGYDAPDIRIVAMARPTKSLLLYKQAIGRGLRPLSEIADELSESDLDTRRFLIACSRKSECLIMDFCGNSGRHKLITLADVLGGKYPEDIREKVTAKIKKSGSEKVVDVEEELERAMEEQRLAQEANARREKERHQKLESRTRFTMIEVDPFTTLGLTKLDNTVKQEGITERQRIFLEKMGIRCSQMSKKEANKVVVEVMRRRKLGLPSFKQQELLQKFGYNDTQKDWKSILDNCIAKAKERREMSVATA